MVRPLLAALLFLAPAFAAEPETVPSVDLERYEGLWYEVARYPNRFEDTRRYTCVGVTAQYELISEERVRVTNTCRKDEVSGEVTAVEGLARVVGPAKLEVAFAPGWLRWLPVVWGDYWVLDLTEDYSAALVGSPDRKYLWLLSRERELDAAVRERFEETAREAGFEPGRLIDVPQRDA